MKRRDARIVIFVALLGIGGSALLLVKTSEPLLLKRATKVANTSPWASPQYVYSWIDSLDRKASLRVANDDSDRSPLHFYRWLDDHELLFFQEKSPEAPTPEGWNFYKRDTLTGQETSLTALSHLAQTSFGSFSQFAISPDGKRIFWTGKGITVATLNGEQTIHLAPETTTNFFKITWTKDSNHLVTYSTIPKAPQMVQKILFDLQARKTTQRLTIDSEFASGATAIDNHLLTIVRKERKNADAPEIVEVDEKEGGNTPMPPHKYTVILPPNIRCGETLFSPQGNRIAWQLIEKEGTMPPVLAWLHRLVPGFNPPPSKPKVSLWVSRLDGSRMHELGYVLVPRFPPSSAVPWSMIFDHLSWLPDGKQISFRHDDALYTVPAD